jgi:3-hydroxyacyl-CoA dehydrogenase
MTRIIGKAAVLGAGVMGAQIAGHLANSGVPVLLFELPSKEGDKSQMARQAIARLKKLRPAPLAAPGVEEMITAANYDEDLPLLGDCDLVVEAIAERMEWKKDLYEKIAPHIADHTVLASNTSGLGINELAAVLPDGLQDRFLGVHFFNPPRYMHLVELIPCKETEPAVLDRLETFFVSTLGKGVVYAKDTPNFIGNRVGVFSMLAVMHHAERLGIAFEVVDQITGKSLGRPKSGTFRTCDVVGLDTMDLVISTLRDNIEGDPWHQCYQSPAYIQKMIEDGSLGQKTGTGIYANKGKQVFSPEQKDYVAADRKIDPEVAAILAERDWGKRIAALRQSKHPEAEFTWATLSDLFHYACVCLADIADTARDVDFAIRWGYGWKQGPFEIMQAAGWKNMIAAVREDIGAGKTLSDTPLPDWVDKIEVVHDESGSWSPTSASYVPLSKHSVYQRQSPREDVLGSAVRGKPGETVFENDAVRLWHEDDGIAVLSFNTRMHVISVDVLAGVIRATEEAADKFDGLVLWHPGAPFSLGADLKEASGLLEEGGLQMIHDMIANFQKASMSLKHCGVPTVAAVQGMALGGGCEFQMHCNLTVAAMESYIGLVEAGVGLLPAGGGLKELTINATRSARDGDLMPHVQRAFELASMAKTSASAAEARHLGLMQDQDVVIANGHELLHVARHHVRALAESGYRPAVREQQVRVAGKTGKATLMMTAINMLEGHFVSEHDYLIADRIATVLTGGDVEVNAMVSQDWLLKLERDFFAELITTPKTQERIAHTMKTGKPLRN